MATLGLRARKALFCAINMKPHDFTYPPGDITDADIDLAAAARLTRDDFRYLPNCGKVTCSVIERWMCAHGYWQSPLRDAKLTTRARNVLYVVLVGRAPRDHEPDPDPREVATKLSVADLRSAENCGKVTLSVIQQWLHHHGYGLV